MNFDDQIIERFNELTNAGITINAHRILNNIYVRIHDHLGDNVRRLFRQLAWQFLQSDNEYEHQLYLYAQDVANALNSINPVNGNFDYNVVLQHIIYAGHRLDLLLNYDGVNVNEDDMDLGDDDMDLGHDDMNVGDDDDMQI